MDNTRDELTSPAAAVPRPPLERERRGGGEAKQGGGKNRETFLSLSPTQEREKTQRRRL